MQHFGFYSEYYIPETEKLAFNLPHVDILGNNNYAGKRNNMFVSRKICPVLSVQVHSQYYYGCKSISMEVV